MKTNRILASLAGTFLSLIILFSGCTDRKKEKLSHIKVHKYKQKSEVVNSDPSDDWIYWYLIMSDSYGNSCYYYSSSTPITNYSTISWTKSADVPYAISSSNPKAEEVEELGEEEVLVDELGEEMQAEVESESNDQSESESSDSDSDGGSDSDSGSDGGGDSGGGDGGGGDGGGGE